MGNVVGVGGIFLDFKGNEEDLHEFYMKYLGLEMSEYGSGFIDGSQLMLLSFKRNSEKMPIINFRVSNIEDIIFNLKSINLETDDILEYDYGKFAHFTDPFGNYIELWQPYEENYRKMVKEEIKKYKLK